MLELIETNKVKRWGHSLAVRIPARLAQMADLQEGSPVELSVEDSKLVIVSARPGPPHYDLDQLLAGINQENLHEEIDLGEAVGAELI